MTPQLTMTDVLTFGRPVPLRPNNKRRHPQPTPPQPPKKDEKKKINNQEAYFSSSSVITVIASQRGRDSLGITGPLDPSARFLLGCAESVCGVMSRVCLCAGGERPGGVPGGVYVCVGGRWTRRMVGVGGGALGQR